jgi:protein SCO1
MRILAFLLFAGFGFSCTQSETRKLPYYDTPDFTPKWELPAEGRFHQIKPFTLTNQQNEVFTEKDIEGKICVVDFFFTTCPGICPKLAHSMGDLQAKFLTDDRVLLLSHSVMPERDSVPVLQRYARDKGVKFSKWKLLTGSREVIYDLGRNYYFVEEDEGVKRTSDVFLHTENFVLIDPNRHIRGIYNGLDPNSMASLIADIEVLKVE